MGENGKCGEKLKVLSNLQGVSLCVIQGVGGALSRTEKASPLITGFTSFVGEEECAISAAGLILYEPVSSCLTDFRRWKDDPSVSNGSSFTTADSGVGAECELTSFVLWVQAVSPSSAQ